MSFKRSEMLYDDGQYYKWSASENGDNPYYRSGSDFSLLARREGYEVIYFINHIAPKYWQAPNVQVYQKIERMIRFWVPDNLRSHKKIEHWIITNWKTVI